MNDTSGLPAHPLDLDRARLVSGTHHDPHSVLGRHPNGSGGTIVRVFHPDAEAAELILDDSGSHPLTHLGGGLFEGTFGEVKPGYRARFTFGGSTYWERADPYCFLPTVGELDLYLFAEGTHRRLWDALGARPMVVDGIAGTSFSVWAPCAQRVSVVGDFCGWDGRLFPMRSLGQSGVWELFIPGVGPGALYKFEILGQNGELRVKADPMGRQMELPPRTASIVSESTFQWTDDDYRWLSREKDIRRQPVHIYELHLGS